MSLPFESLTEQILAAAFQVANELGPGFLESVYEGALFIALQERDLRAERQVPIRVHFHGHLVGNYCADILVEGQIVLEFKAVRALAAEHIAQTLNYLKATGMPVALLINFGAAKLEWRRFDNRFKDKQLNRDEGDSGDEKGNCVAEAGDSPGEVLEPTSNQSVLATFPSQSQRDGHP